MEIKARYVHGSEDSTDIDTYYVVDALPSTAECKKWCDALTEENANLITIGDGIVTGCYKGTVDEVNNSLFETYPLHEQEFPLLVERKVRRDLNIKFIRAIRGLLSHMSRSQYRPEIKAALKSGWNERLDVLKGIYLPTIDFSMLNKHMSDRDIKKVFAFQIGQSLGLLDGVELYTKSSIAATYPPLNPFLYREDADTIDLQMIVDEFVSRMEAIPVEEMDGNVVRFVDADECINVQTERHV